jgi:hypothetical protein
VRVTLLLEARIVLITKLTVIQRTQRARLPLTRILRPKRVTTPAMNLTAFTSRLTPVLRILGPTVTLLLPATTPMLKRLQHRHFNTVTRLQPQTLPRITN